METVFSFNANSLLAVLLAAVMLVTGAAPFGGGANPNVMEHDGPIEIQNISDHPFQTGKILDVCAGDVRYTFTTPDDDALLDAFRLAACLEPTEFPLELGPGDGFTFEAGRAARSMFYPRLTLANGNVLTLSCKATGTVHVALADLAGKSDLTVRVEWDGSSGTLYAAAGGTDVTAPIVKLSEILAKDPAARLRVEYATASEPAITLDDSRGSDRLRLLVTLGDGRQFRGTCAVEDQALVAAAQALLPGASVVLSDVETVERMNDYGEITGRTTTGVVTVTDGAGRSVTFGLVDIGERRIGTVTIQSGDGTAVSVPAEDIIFVDYSQYNW